MILTHTMKYRRNLVNLAYSSFSLPFSSIFLIFPTIFLHIPLLPYTIFRHFPPYSSFSLCHIPPYSAVFPSGRSFSLWPCSNGKVPYAIFLSVSVTVSPYLFMAHISTWRISRPDAISYGCLRSADKRWEYEGI